ncbi:bifunctional 3,4-dihydroxy-2-butanone 4-phosphate synthase/GTP cyclohydrolase II/unknown domain fusion protein [Gloeomargarita lithophora Alchichica-D10]|uniref:Riboflavin biosynthesis protein RibBA n=1 Tax=Gloeomargarita lithophora Alchichica-D10 TaxID=1188229 RepID=A0A1J0ACS3_9CYAN|nr:bifunctional 3,4-dihydroxy-2-butanone-4-phosphate synthase/GTP cyclohydrolase II [Gloeomargarita lithophora]APB33733.1 bifunctional 3,4-dihydroxy-2-butanone 4-phosphate synthase/GTP cyclohydrolase II/unknown domain fusion protein [Gloeomargarita lithophora Alchichica-D10]
MSEGGFAKITEALAALRAGKAIVVVDDEQRENEGDLICAAQFATPSMVNFMAVEARGLICLALTGARLDELNLPLMVSNNTDSNQTAFTVSIDASPELGVTTGISAEDRAKTIQAVLDSQTRPEDLRRPGHVFPIRAKAGGVLERAGHTEAAVDLARLAGLYPAGVICEIQNPDGSMARLPDLFSYAQKHHLLIISIADLIQYRLHHERFVQRQTVADLPSEFGQFQIYGYRNQRDGSEHVAVVKGDPREFAHQPVLVRVHSECLTGDALGSLRCDCRRQLQSALKMIEHAGQGVVVYLRQEGRGIGLINKLKAYTLQDQGLDTVEANEKLGFPADLRNYGVGAQMLHDLGVNQIRLITNNPRKIAGLRGYGLTVVERVPLMVEVTHYNLDYLATKADKLGHLLLQTYLITLGLHWQTPPTPAARYTYLEKLRHLSTAYDLHLREVTRPVARAVFDQAELIVHLGFDQPELAPPDWYRQAEHPYTQAIIGVLGHIRHWPNLAAVEFLLAPGTDPLLNLQVQLDRRAYPTTGELTTQVIYRWAFE